MRSARQREEHRAALDRRLEQLRAEMAGVGPERPGGTQVRRPPDPALVPPDDLPGPVAEPGRHAARPGLRWTLTPAHLRVIALLLLAALLLSGWWLLRARPEAVPGEVGLTVTEPSGAPQASAARSPDRPEAASRAVGAQPEGGEPEVIVHVAGRVRRPGIVELPPGSRVVDALDAAGGARPGVPLRDLNLARALVDGEQVLVGMPGGSAAPPEVATGTAGGTTSEAGAAVNLNTADGTELETLPGVGPVTAGKILTWREENGRFTAVEELLEVDGIGDVTLAELTPLVTV